MTASVHELHRELPRTAGVRHPARLMLHGLRPGAAAIVHRRWDLELHGTENVPARGPVVIAANHIGFFDGPLMAIVGPRPVHALTKGELFSGPLGAFLHGAGQIPVNRDEVDPRAVKTALRVLRDGGVVGMFPESTRGAGTMATAAPGAAYLAMAAGATVVPLAFLGTRLPGSAASFPPAGSRLVLRYGAPLSVAPRPWPRRTAEVGALTDQIRRAIADCVRAAEQTTGMSLPGPIPEADPAPDQSKDMQ